MHQRFNMIQAVLFDMDGTLLNSEPLHAQALLQVLDLPKDFDCHPFTGMSDYHVFQILRPGLQVQDYFALIQAKNDVLISRLKLMELSELQKLLTPGCYQILAALKQQKIPAGLVSASEESIIEVLVERLGFNEYLDQIHTRQQTARSKPCGSPYFKAMRNLRVSGHQCLIFEDSPTGLQAALETGSQVIQICAYTPNTIKDLESYDSFLGLIS